MKVPKIVQETAQKHGFNSIGYIGKRKGKHAFLLGIVDKTGEACPTGLPTVCLTDKETVEIFSGIEGLELL